MTPEESGNFQLVIVRQGVLGLRLGVRRGPGLHLRARCGLHGDAGLALRGRNRIVLAAEADAGEALEQAGLLLLGMSDDRCDLGLVGFDLLLGLRREFLNRRHADRADLRLRALCSGRNRADRFVANPGLFLVLLHEGHSLTEQELIDFVKKRKGSLMAPKSVEFVTTIALTNLGKLDKKAMRAQYWGGRSRNV